MVLKHLVYTIVNLILGVGLAALIPLGMLWLAIKWANKVDRNEKQS
jgi:hypothetical protein